MNSCQQTKRSTATMSALLLALLCIFICTDDLKAANIYAAVLVRSSNQFFTAPDSPSVSVTGDMTIEAWVKLPSQPPNGVSDTIVSKSTESGNQASFTLRYLDISGVKSLDAFISSDGTSGTPQQHPSVAATIPTGQWTHIALVYSASAGTLIFYTNGIQAGATNTGMPHSIFDGTAPFLISGYDGGVQSTLLDGEVDDVRLWATARTQAQIVSTMTNELSGTEFNLRGYWKLNNSLADSTTNGNTLVNNNSATFESNDVPFLYSRPVIVTQPANTFALPSGSASFSVVASSDLPISYQWFTTNSPILGATNSILNLSNIQSTNIYSVTVSNSVGSVVSSNASLTIVMPGLDDDGDGLPNELEIEYGTNPHLADTDGDGISDYDEIFVYHTNPLLADTDGDGIPDDWEVQHGLNPLVNDATQIGSDGVSNFQIYQYDKTNSTQLDPRNPFFAPGTSIYEVLNNGQHTNRYYYDHEDRLVGVETSRGISLAYTYDGNSNLKRQTVLSRAGETNGLPVLWQFLNGLTNGTTASGPYGDPDGDGWSNYQEWLAGTDPNNSTSVPNLLSNPGTNIASLALPFTPSNFVVGIGQLDGATGDEIVVGGDGNPNGTTNSILVLINNGVAWTTQKLSVGNFGVTSIAIGQLSNRPAPAIYAGLRQTGGQGRIREFILQNGTWITNDIMGSSNEAAFVIVARSNADLLASVSTNGYSSPLCSLQFSSNAWNCAVVSTNNSSRGLGVSAFLFGNIPRYGAARLSDSGGIEVFGTGLEFLTNRSLLPTNSIYNPAADKWYFLTPTNSDWSDAETYCQQNMGNLVTIGSDQENQFIHSNYPNVFHIGLDGNTIGYNPAQVTAWTWVSGNSSSYRNWAPGQPTSNDGIHSATGYSVRMNVNGQWEPEFAYAYGAPQTEGIGELNGSQGEVVIPETPAAARLTWRGASLATGFTRPGKTNGFSLIYVCVDDKNNNGQIDGGDDFVFSEYIVTTNSVTTNSYIRTSIGNVTGQGSYGLTTANFLNNGTNTVFTTLPDGTIFDWSATNSSSPLQQQLFSDSYKGVACHALATVKMSYGGEGIAGLMLNPTNQNSCNIILWSPQAVLPTPQPSLIETAPSAAVIPSANPLGSNAVVTIRLWDNEGNASTPFLQYQILGSTTWQNATLTTLDGASYNLVTRVTALPTGNNHTLAWNALADFGANIVTNILLRASAQDFMLTGNWSSPTPFQLNTTVATVSNPTNPPVNFTGFTRIQGGIGLNWQSGSNAFLYLQRSPALAGTNAVWVNIWTGAPPTLMSGSYTDFFGTNLMEFYRMKIVSP